MKGGGLGGMAHLPQPCLTFALARHAGRSVRSFMRLRQIALLLASLTASAPATAALGLRRQFQRCERLDIIDLATHQITKTIPLLREPHHLVLSPDGKSLVIGDTTGNALFFLDPVTGDIQRRITVSDPYQLQYSPNGKLLTTAGLARNQIDIYDAGTYKLLHRVPARSMPSHMAYTPDSSVVFVSLQGTNALIAIRTSDGAVLWNTKVGRTPAGVFYTRGKILVGIMGDAHIAVVDPATGRVERNIPTGRGAHTLFFNADHSLIYATNRVDGSISVLDPITLACQTHVARAGWARRSRICAGWKNLGGFAVRAVGGHHRSGDGRDRAYCGWAFAARDLDEYAPEGGQPVAGINSASRPDGRPTHAAYCTRLGRIGNRRFRHCFRRGNGARPFGAFMTGPTDQLRRSCRQSRYGR